MKHQLIIPVIASATLLIGCIDNATVPNNSDKPNSNEPPPLKQSEPEQSMNSNNSQTSGAIELPGSVLAPAISNLSERLGISESDIQVLRATSVTWNNGATGCPEPGVAYTQALVPGFWVVLAHGGKLYSYHATRNSALRLCENAQLKSSDDPPNGRLNEDI